MQGGSEHGPGVVVASMHLALHQNGRGEASSARQAQRQALRHHRCVVCGVHGPLGPIPHLCRCVE